MAEQEVVSRVIPLPGFRLGKSLSAWLGIPANSPGREEYQKSLREIDSAERDAYQAAQGVIVL